MLEKDEQEHKRDRSAERRTLRVYGLLERVIFDDIITETDAMDPESKKRFCAEVLKIVKEEDAKKHGSK